MDQLLYGAAYYDEYMPYDRLDKDVEMMKKAEDGNGYILRIYENRNTRTPMTVTLGFEAYRAEECDLLERPLKLLETDGHTFKDFILPYEIKTYRIIPAGA